jgi:hypothetical protein
LQEEGKTKKYSVAVHIHPPMLIFSLLSDNLCYIYTTIEIPTSPKYSVVIRPSLWDCKIARSGGWFGSNAQNLYRTGTDLGVRSYSNKKGKGFYTQVTVGVFHRKYEDYGSYYDDNGKQHYGLTPDSESFWEIDIMGYIGGSIKPKKSNLSIFFDGGIGVGSHPMRAFISSEGGFFSHHRSDGSFRFDWNFGIGLKF